MRRTHEFRGSPRPTQRVRERRRSSRETLSIAARHTGCIPGTGAMQTPVQITFRDLSRSGPITAEVHSRVERLEHLFGALTRCHVVLQARPHSHRRGNVHGVSIEVTLPGGETVSSRDCGENHEHENVYVAIRDTFNALARELQSRFKKKRQLQPKSELPRSS